jgi:hypothetical protein
MAPPLLGLLHGPLQTGNTGMKGEAPLCILTVFELSSLFDGADLDPKWRLPALRWLVDGGCQDADQSHLQGSSSSSPRLARSSHVTEGVDLQPVLGFTDTSVLECSHHRLMVPPVAAESPYRPCTAAVLIPARSLTS